MSIAIGDRFHAILVDNGVMRLNECANVQKTLKSHLGINLTLVDASDLFLDRLQGVIIKNFKHRLLIQRKNARLLEIRSLRFLKQRQPG